MTANVVTIPRPPDDAPRKKIIIDTDPGVDDTMAILLALASPEVEILGLTTIFGNVKTPTATSNAILLMEMTGHSEIPVAEGELVTSKGAPKIHVADFVHGTDGMGNTFPDPPKGSAISKSGPQFLVDVCAEFPGEITVVALGPLTNLSKAVKMDSKFATNVKQIVILGGAFFCNGNVNPCTEANIYGDPDAADDVFTCGADIIAVGINITHQVFLTAKELEELRDSPGPYGVFLYNMCQYYMAYHKDAYGMDAIYLHDPATMVAAFRPDLFTYISGAVRVQTEGISTGLTCLNSSVKKFHGESPWTGKPPVKVAVTVESAEVAKICKERLMRPLPTS
eukprot:TRINITY_DN10928_c0_g2_i1.p1 TRINITY_DN10928_c0_g2~~TRINITY_DN10928_c0_g2_i1.p1  ORF type:complete len:347 (-),score=50.62 TRINITY_DN10928_c0_g2_i1:578-1591(-)